jgi:hypothetical protein
MVVSMVGPFLLHHSASLVSSLIRVLSLGVIFFSAFSFFSFFSSAAFLIAFAFSS